jgi:hypothetical protein
MVPLSALGMTKTALYDNAIREQGVGLAEKWTSQKSQTLDS